MEEGSLKEKTASGLFWSGFGNLFQQVIQLVFAIFMGRILFPDDFGLVAMLSIFTLVATTLQESGFSIALINKQEINRDDYSSVFWVNGGISLLLYALLFFAAPWIADFYRQPLLTDLSRFVFLSFVFNAFGIIQNTVLTKRLEIKKLTFVNLASLLIACSTGLTLALLGFAYWAIAAQMVVLSFSKTLILWAVSSWRPALCMKKSPLQSMFTFSIKLLISTLCSHLSNGMYSLLLGKCYDEKQTGYYSQAYRWFSIPLGIVIGIVSSISLPVLAEVNNNDERQRLVFRKMLRFTAFITFPVILGTAFIAKELILILVTDRWLDSVVILQLLCITGIFLPIVVIYLNLLTSKGHSGVVLSLNAAYCFLMIGVLLLTIRYGIRQMIICNGILYLFNLLFTILATRKYIGLTIRHFIYDVFPFLGITCVVFTMVYLIVHPIENLYFSLGAKIVLSVLFYFLIMQFSKIVIFRESVRFLKTKLLNKKS